MRAPRRDACALGIVGVLDDLARGPHLAAKVIVFVDEMGLSAGRITHQDRVAVMIVVRLRAFARAVRLRNQEAVVVVRVLLEQRALG